MKYFTLEIEDPKLNEKIEALAKEWQISPDELVSRIIEKYVDGRMVTSST